MKMIFIGLPTKGFRGGTPAQKQITLQLEQLSWNSQPQPTTITTLLFTQARLI